MTRIRQISDTDLPDLQDNIGRLGESTETRRDRLFLTWFVHADHDREQDSDPYKRADKLIQDIMKARTTSQFESVIEDAAPDNLHAIPQLVRSLLPSVTVQRHNFMPSTQST